MDAVCFSQYFITAASRSLLLIYVWSVILNTALVLDCIDVYITTTNRVKLIDFNPIGGATSPLLFTWEELLCQDSVSNASESTRDAQQEEAAGYLVMKIGRCGFINPQLAWLKMNIIF